MEHRRPQLRVLVVAGEPALARDLADAAGAGATVVDRLAEGIALHRAQPFALVLAAPDREGRTWRDACGEICDVPVVAVLERTEDAREAVTCGAADFLSPPHASEETALRIAAAKARAAERWAVFHALDLTGVVLEIADGDGRYQYVGSAFERVTGYSPHEARGRTPAQLLRSAVQEPGFHEAIWAQVSAGKPWSGSFVSRRKDGALFSHQAGIVPVPADDGAPRQVAVKRETTAETRSVERSRVLMESAGDAILMVDSRTMRFVEANAAACRMFGYAAEDFLELDTGALAAPGQETAVLGLRADLAAEGRAWHPAMQVQRSDGSRFWVEVRVTAFEAAGTLLYASIIRDVSDRVRREEELARSYRDLQQMQAQLVQADRLAAVGELAASVAHEINNPATYAMLNLGEARKLLASLERDHPGLGGELPSLIGETLDGVRRIATIVQDLRTFSRIERGDRTSVDVNDVVRVACRMAHNQLRHRAELTIDLTADAPVEGDAAKLCQVVINLLVNAAHAIDSQTTGARRVAVRTFLVGEDVAITVEDTGIGIPESIKGRVFEPFFTTKPEGQSTGLGLSLSTEIVAEHGGRIDLESEVDRGTRVTVRLPASHRRTPTRSDALAPATEQGELRILVVDDEPMVLKALSRALRDLGSVTVSRGGPAALVELARGAEFDVVICDLMMPEMDGRAVFEAISAARPGLRERFVFCSGGVFTPRARDFLASTTAPLVHKPATPRELERAILGVLSIPD